MRRIHHTILALAAVTGLVISCTTLPPSQRPVVAVPVISNGTDKKMSPELMASITDRFITEMIRSRKFAVVERARIKELLAEHKLEMTGLLKTDDAIKIGKLVKAPYVVLAQVNACEIRKDGIGSDMGGVYQITIQVELTARIIETERGVSLAAGKAGVTDKKRLVHLKTVVDGVEKGIVSLGGDPDNMDPAIKAAFMKAARLLADDLIRQKW